MAIISIIFPLIFMVVLGFVLTRVGFFNKEHIAGISKFTFYVSIPAFLFINMLAAPLAQSIDPFALLAFYLPVLLVFAIGYRINRLFSPIALQGRDASAVFALGASYSNTVLVGLPIIIAALGPAMIGQVFMIITFHSATLFALTFILAARAQPQGFSWRRFARSMALNPVVMSIGLGIFANALSINLGPQLDDGLALLAKPALACALFVLGANLSFYRVGEHWRLALMASSLKIILLPALVYVMAHFVFELAASSTAMLVLLSASPLGVNAYLIATELKQHESTLGSTVVLSTLLSVFSFSLWLTLLL
ncbi:MULTISPECIES: AEC family transporter [unclassified Shewanella]|uniref:AEC family transporter n=1 Tax=unclassified Shewanella TaxID=196818 RepID=UPI00137BDC17|nr:MULTISPECIES: AEC family transporter [unclassified Shewanella]MBB1362023.1 AEC family transporter [Shewanella sp. SR44-4]QHS13860.1 AEC family transporter [Shewanella sp. Arc9-LZ]